MKHITGAARAERRAFEQLSLDREAGKLPGPSCTSERACKPHLLLHQSRPRYTMLDWHPSAQINMARLEPRVTTSALEMWHWSLLSCLERERHELQSVCTRESARGAKRRGRGDEMCSAWSRSTVDHDKACCRFEDLRCLEAVPPLRCSHGSKRLGARPARPLRPLHRVDDEEGRQNVP